MTLLRFMTTLNRTISNTFVLLFLSMRPTQTLLKCLLWNDELLSCVFHWPWTTQNCWIWNIIFFFTCHNLDIIHKSCKRCNIILCCFISCYLTTNRISTWLLYFKVFFFCKVLRCITPRSSQLQFSVISFYVVCLYLVQLYSCNTSCIIFAKPFNFKWLEFLHFW